MNVNCFLSRFGRVVLSMLCTMAVWGQPQNGVENGTAANFVIGVDDTVTIVATKADEISKAWRVAATGDLNLPLIGRVHAAGLTPEQLEQELKAKLGKYLVDPQVVVYLSEFRSMPVTVSGAVEHPGVIQIQGARGLFDVIMRAGGPRDAGETVTVTRRLEPGKTPFAHPAAREVDGNSVVELPLASVLEGRGANADLQIVTGDVVSVSDVKQQKLVYILGAVNKPGVVELVSQDKVSLLQLIALAGGFTPVASKGSSYVRHASLPDGRAETTKLDLEKILKGKSPDVNLVEGDTVVIPSSRLQSIMQVVPQSAVSTGLLMLGRF